MTFWVFDNPFSRIRDAAAKNFFRDPGYHEINSGFLGLVPPTHPFLGAVFFNVH